MSEDKFSKIILAICVIWAFSVAGLLAYTFDLQSKCSIISYISCEKVSNFNNHFAYFCVFGV